MIAEVIPPVQDLATKSDIQVVKSDLQVVESNLRAEINVVEANLRAEIHVETGRVIKWMVGLLIPVWAGTWATVIALILKG
jgi:hypothetical protein